MQFQKTIIPTTEEALHALMMEWRPIALQGNPGLVLEQIKKLANAGIRKLVDAAPKQAGWKAPPIVLERLADATIHLGLTMKSYTDDSFARGGYYLNDAGLAAAGITSPEDLAKARKRPPYDSEEA